MSQNGKTRILLADDEPDVLRVMKDTLEHEGFAVRTAADGTQALSAIREELPDIAVLDYKMPGKDGFAVCRELRGDPLLEQLPVIILSAWDSEESKVAGLESGADDFMSKPVNTAELVARIHMILRRARQGLDANPLTRLPGNVAIENRIKEALAAGRPLAVLYFDLNQFKAYNDAYGFDAGDRVIKATAALLLRLVRIEGAKADFLGHIGGDDFIALTDPSRMEALAKRVIAEFDALAPSFYKEEDRRRGKLAAADRQGRLQEFPFLSIAVGICHNQRRKLTSYAQVAQYGTELKKHAKRHQGSACEIDRRTA